ncbi:hypothetical protein C8N24_5035 [Solirubrobacter pauli]|uniref:Uncharacterized protein n=1 Tax=Solirubrobacter pauli TaxID=166793 RepID=A0A660L110_9ACTN|nr:hypothetical protein [Solirubrobacter pauli]RKQ87015.1 hypothetical protein C8N24_5035 [Solirubrobacter pauli]
MHPDRTADPARHAGTARGLGVCDALRVELTARHRPGLEHTLDERTAALRRQLHARVATPDTATAPPDDPERSRLREELRLLERMRAGLPDPPAGPFVLLGPSGLVLELVADSLHAAVGALAAGLQEGGAHPASATATLEAAGAWITTALDCRAVEAFSLDAGVDPVHAW